MTESTREQSLDEIIDALPPNHRARKELAQLRRREARDSGADGPSVKDEGRAFADLVVERYAYLRVVEGAHGALTDCGTVPVPDGLGESLVPAIEHLRRERDEARALADKLTDDLMPRIKVKAKRDDASSYPFCGKGELPPGSVHYYREPKEAPRASFVGAVKRVAWVLFALPLLVLSAIASGGMWLATGDGTKPRDWFFETYLEWGVGG